MSTTRHLVNRRRRLSAAPPAPRARTAPAAVPVPVPASEAPAEPADAEAAPPAPRSRLRGRRAPLVLAAATVLLGAFAAWSAGQAAALRDEPALHNAALTDVGRTSEVKGQLATAVAALFSYDHTAPAAADRAVRAHLTGKAVEQHRAMLAPVRAQGPRQKLVLTTTVTHSGVELLDGDRARVLVYADQRNTRTAAAKDAAGQGAAAKAAGDTAYGAAMFAVEAVRTGGAWRISAIDTLGAGS
ncbi:hypothetical protein C6N75_24285 [Streptomyces solincola]|uniref:Integral membrane protein n=1 Tax=Streptomyces solincola TaxID=2100817 RepID=A0A2S9PQS1_9ACTN|nr:hypothetical protein [Streptomyces solincola]PRH76687.1 hypothetical protein C6N75_24285 [Streptomyces solincola]